MLRCHGEDSPPSLRRPQGTVSQHCPWMWGFPHCECCEAKEPSAGLPHAQRWAGVCRRWREGLLSEQMGIWVASLPVGKELREGLVTPPQPTWSPVLSAQQSPASPGTGQGASPPHTVTAAENGTSGLPGALPVRARTTAPGAHVSTQTCISPHLIRSF